MEEQRIWTKKEIEEFQKFQEGFDKFFQWVREHPEVIRDYYDRFANIRDAETGEWINGNFEYL